MRFVIILIKFYVGLCMYDMYVCMYVTSIDDSFMFVMQMLIGLLLFYKAVSHAHS